MSKYFRPRSFAMIILVLILAAAVYGFANANTMPGTTYAGYGEDTIAGYTITNVQNRLQSGAPRNIDQVTFTVSPTGTSSVYVSLQTGGAWHSCTEGGAGLVTCDLTVVGVQDAFTADLLQISATD